MFAFLIHDTCVILLGNQIVDFICISISIIINFVKMTAVAIVYAV